MADVAARCAAREVRTPTQYVARWTEVAVVKCTRKLAEELDRPKAKRGSGGRGKRWEAVAVRRLSEVRDREITHGLRWNRCAELAVSLELTGIEAALLTVVSMFCVTSAFVCWETRAAAARWSRRRGRARIRGSRSHRPG